MGRTTIKMSVCLDCLFLLVMFTYMYSRQYFKGRTKCSHGLYLEIHKVSGSAPVLARLSLAGGYAGSNIMTDHHKAQLKAGMNWWAWN